MTARLLLLLLAVLVAFSILETTSVLETWQRSGAALERPRAVAGQLGAMRTRLQSNLRVYRTARPVIVDDVLAEAAPVPPWQLSSAPAAQSGADAPRSRLGVPLIVRDRVIGMISIGHERVGHLGE